MIIDDNGQLIGDQPIFSQYNEITGLAFQAMDLLALQRVAEAYRVVIGSNSNGRVSRCGAGTTSARVNGAQRADGGILQIASRASARVGLTAFSKRFKRIVMPAAALTLVGDRPVPFETVPLQCCKDQFGGAGLFPRRINVFNPDKPLALMPPRFEVAGNSGNQRAEM